MKVYVLFQTDIYKTKNSRVCFGVYETFEGANLAAKENDLYAYDSEVVIIETDLGEFNEL